MELCVVLNIGSSNLIVIREPKIARLLSCLIAMQSLRQTLRRPPAAWQSSPRLTIPASLSLCELPSAMIATSADKTSDSLVQ